jgi:MFS family permease
MPANSQRGNQRAGEDLCADRGTDLFKTSIDTDVPPRSARLATSGTFIVHSALFASWTPHVPEFKERLGLDAGTLGAALLGAPVGSVLAMLVTGAALARWGSKRVVTTALIGYLCAGPMLGLVNSGWTLFAVLAVWGGFQGGLGVAINAQAATVERAYARPIMSSFHAWWSLATFGGTGLGILALTLRVNVSFQLGLLAVLAAAASPLLIRPMLGGDHAPVHRRLVMPWRQPTLAAFALIAAAALLCEGAAGDWAAVYLRESLHAAPETAGAGYAMFAIGMFVGRATADRSRARLGARRLVRLLAIVATIGLGAALPLAQPVVALVGFAALGLGVSVTVPVIFSVAARLPDTHPGQAITAVSTAGWAGFLLGPPLIGGLAQATALPIALALLPVLCACIAVGARTLR